MPESWLAKAEYGNLGNFGNVEGMPLTEDLLVLLPGLALTAFSSTMADCKM